MGVEALGHMLHLIIVRYLDKRSRREREMVEFNAQNGCRHCSGITFLSSITRSLQSQAPTTISSAGKLGLACTEAHRKNQGVEVLHHASQIVLIQMSLYSTVYCLASAMSLSKGQHHIMKILYTHLHHHAINSGARSVVSTFRA